MPPASCRTRSRRRRRAAVPYRRPGAVPGGWQYRVHRAYRPPGEGSRLPYRTG
nr:hypothetical protein [Pseudomonas aeruginosa]